RRRRGAARAAPRTQSRAPSDLLGCRGIPAQYGRRAGASQVPAGRAKLKKMCTRCQKGDPRRHVLLVRSPTGGRSAGGGAGGGGRPRPRPASGRDGRLEGSEIFPYKRVEFGWLTATIAQALPPPVSRRGGRDGRERISEAPRSSALTPARALVVPS